jgi:hypothetical protein
VPRRALTSLARAVYWGGGDPEAFAGGFFQYSGFLVCQVLFTIPWLLCREGAPCCFQEFKLFPNGFKWSLIKLVVPVALFDAGDKWFQLFGIKAAGSGLYIVIFSSLTVWTALIRRFGFGLTLAWVKWLAVLVITAGLAVDAAAALIADPIKGVDMYLIGGLLAATTAALFDALMYCFAEHALDAKDESNRPSEADFMWLIGLIDFPIILAYILAYVAMGDWDELVVDKIHDAGTCDVGGSSSGGGDDGAAPKTASACETAGGEWVPAGGTLLSVGLLWCFQGFNLWLHYITFFYCCKLGSAVSGAVNKALQSASIFVLSWAVYCPPALVGHLSNEDQCLTPPKIICAVTVIGGVLLYAFGPIFCPEKTETTGLKAGLIQA